MNLTKTEMNSGATFWNFENELVNSNACLIVGTSGSGKTTLLKEMLQHLRTSYQLMLFSLKPDRKESSFKRVLVIDEFFFLGKTKIGEEIHKHIADILPFIRASNFKMILLSQSLNKSKSKHFDIDLCNLKLINLPEIRNYLESLGHIPSKFVAIKLRRGQFIKFSMQESPTVITHTHLAT